MSSSTPTRMPRGSRAGASLVAALLATAICVFAAVEAISLAARGRTLGFDVHAVTRFGRTTHWDATAATVIGIVVAVVGLALLLSALLPPSRRAVELTAEDGRVALGLPRSSLRRALVAAVLAIDGVSAARVRGRRRLTVKATTELRDTTGLADAIQATVTGQLTALHPRRRRTVRVRLDRKDR